MAVLYLPSFQFYHLDPGLVKTLHLCCESFVHHLLWLFAMPLSHLASSVARMLSQRIGKENPVSELSHLSEDSELP